MTTQGGIGGRLIQTGQPLQKFTGRDRIQMAIKKRHRFINGLNEATGFRLQGQGNQLVSLLMELNQVRHMTHHVLHHGADILVRPDQGLEGTGHGTDGAAHAVRQNIGKDVGQLVCIGQPGWIPPVRQVDIFLNRRAVKIAIGEAI